jgi:hypothetical protein
MGTTMTTVQMMMLVMTPSIAVVAVLFCKPAFRRGLALHPRGNPDLIAEPGRQFVRSE